MKTVVLRAVLTILLSRPPAPAPDRRRAPVRFALPRLNLADMLYHFDRRERDR